MHEIKIAAIFFPKQAGKSNSRLFINCSGSSILHSISSHFHPRCQIKYRPTPLISAFFFFFLRGSFSQNTPVHIKEGCSFNVQCSGSWFLHSIQPSSSQVSNQMQTIPIISAVYDYFQNMSRNPSCQQVIRMLLFVNCLFSELAKTNLIGKLQNT